MADTALIDKEREIEELLRAWVLSVEEERSWSAFVEGLGETDLTAIRACLAGRAPRSASADTLESYLQWYRSAKADRAGLIDALSAASPTLRERCETLRKSLQADGGRPLTAEEIERIFAQDETIVEFLCSLSVIQLESWKQQLDADLVPMDPAAKSSLLALFGKLQEEAFAFEQEWMREVGPLAAGVATALQLQDQIAALERMQAQLSPKAR